MSEKLLTKKRKAWVGKFKPTAVLRGTVLHHNAAVSNRYRDSLKKLVREMTAESVKQIRKLYASDHAKAHFSADASITAQARIITNSLSNTFAALFSKRAPSLAESMVNRSAAASKSSLHESLKALSGGLSIKSSEISPSLRQIMKASVVENVGLIKSIQSDYATKLQGAVMRSITHGDGLEGLIPTIEKLGEMTERRATNIALDQTRKVFSTINADRMQGLGVRKFEWVHSGGGAHPRELHMEYDGEIFSFDDLPVIDENTGETGIPAQAINCGCTMIPVIEFENGETTDDGE